MAGITVVFDFDKTIIDVDSDNWVLAELGATTLFEGLISTMPWNSLMDRMMREVHAQGKTIEDIKDVLKRVPIHPRIVPAIKAAHSLGCDLRIVSDANTFFIETILDHLGIKNCFSEINTNPSYVDEEGILRISPYVDFESSPHGCSNPCPPNMCKGMIIERIKSNQGNNKRMIYLGDGIGDFCSCLKLKEGDFMLPRKNYPVWDLICQNRAILRPQIREWSDGAEMEQILVEVIEKIRIEETTNQDLTVDSKFETMNIPMALPPPLRVNQ